MLAKTSNSLGRYPTAEMSSPVAAPPCAPEPCRYPAWEYFCVEAFGLPSGPEALCGRYRGQTRIGGNHHGMAVGPRGGLTRHPAPGRRLGNKAFAADTQRRAGKWVAVPQGSLRPPLCAPEPRPLGNLETRCKNILFFQVLFLTFLDILRYL